MGVINHLDQKFRTRPAVITRLNRFINHLILQKNQRLGKYFKTSKISVHVSKEDF